jgi:sec-independent protein translocase protein TatC
MQDMTPTSSSGAPPEPKRPGQDDIDASKAPLMDHLIELRQRLIYTLVGILIGFVFCFAFAQQLYLVLVKPFVWAAHWATGDEKQARMIFTHPAEFFFTQLKLSLFGAVCLSFPNIALQLYKFIAPGLYRDEKAAFYPYLIATPILFIVGALVVYFIVAPMMMYFFLKMQFSDPSIQIDLLPRVADYLSMIMTLIFGFGIMFQLPIVLTLLARVGLIGAQSLRDFRRYAVVAITGVAAVLSPPDPFSMIAMALPTILLYEASILIVDRVEKARLAQEAADAGAA